MLGFKRLFKIRTKKSLAMLTVPLRLNRLLQRNVKINMPFF